MALLRCKVTVYFDKFNTCPEVTRKTLKLLKATSKCNAVSSKQTALAWYIMHPLKKMMINFMRTTTGMV